MYVLRSNSLHANKGKIVGTQEGNGHKLEIKDPRKERMYNKMARETRDCTRYKGGGLTAERVSEVREEV